MYQYQTAIQRVYRFSKWLLTSMHLKRAFMGIINSQQFQIYQKSNKNYKTSKISITRNICKQPKTHQEHKLNICLKTTNPTSNLQPLAMHSTRPIILEFCIRKRRILVGWTAMIFKIFRHKRNWWQCTMEAAQKRTNGQCKNLLLIIAN